MSINNKLKHYIETAVLPKYQNFDKGHRLDHIQKVIDDSLELAVNYDVDVNMVYVIAAYHDIGIERGREFHHIYSGETLAADENLKQWFSAEQLQTMREAIEDHRASSKSAPRSIYGKIVAEADRDISPQTILRRTIQYGLKNMPAAGFDAQFERALNHLRQKYGEGGYLKLYLHSAKNEVGLAQVRAIIGNKEILRKMCFEIYNQEIQQK